MTAVTKGLTRAERGAAALAARSVADYHQFGPELAFHVLGEPVSQGAVSFLGKGRPAVHTNRKRLLPWRAAVTAAAVVAKADQVSRLNRRADRFPMDGPVGLDVTFTMPKPVSAPKLRRTYPDRYPDLSHLIRAVEDAITAAGVWVDDARVVDCSARKVYPGEHVQALDVPGAIIRVYRVGAPR